MSAGADVDALVIKNREGLPFVPGKTLKGLVREAIEEIAPVKGLSSESIESAFGKESSLTGEGVRGCLFFTDAVLDEMESRAIVSHKLTKYMYHKLSSTAIDDEKGVAKEHSLRKMEVAVPCLLQGEIQNVPENMGDELIEALKFIKRLGQNRNRGLGRCSFIHIK